MLKYFNKLLDVSRITLSLLVAALHFPLKSTLDTYLGLNRQV